MGLNETHHQYENPDHDTKYLPCKEGDTYRLFHGFRDKHHAVEAASRGISGKIKADRVYSYEYDSNPNGLFVSISFKVACEFGRVIMEFKADSGQLEAPVWPGGSYTVQGGLYNKYFGRGREGRIARNQRQKDAEKEIENEIKARDDLEHIKLSDKKYLSYLLTNSREKQALFVGDLNPKDIIAFHVADNNTVYSTYTKYTVEEFLSKFSEEVIKLDTKKNRKIFLPNDTFDPRQFVERMAEVTGHSSHKELDDILRGFWPDIVKSQNRKAEFLHYYENFLWPKQYGPAFNWMKKEYGVKSKIEETWERLGKIGKPIDIVAFHGTNAQFRSFNPKHKGTAHGTAPINMLGFNFTDNEAVAKTFGSNIIKARIKMQRPYIIDAKGESYSDFREDLNAELDAIETGSYDGVIIKNYGDAGRHGNEYIKSNHYIPLDHKNIQILNKNINEDKENNITNGLYVAARFIPESIDHMIDFVEHFEIPNFVDEFHTTIVYSRKSINWNDADEVYKKVKPSKWEVWDMRDGKKCLVLQLESKYLTKRWRLAMDRGATYDFPDYKPHISFSYGIDEDFDPSSLPLPTFDIVIKDEYSEPLDSNK